MDILNLINKKNWETIEKKIIDKKFNINKKIHNGNYLIHYIGLNNNENLFDVISNKKYNINIAQLNDDGDTVGHIAAKFGYYNLLKKIVKKKPQILNKIDNNGNTILNLIYNNKRLLEYFFNNYKKNINSIDNINNKGNTILLHNINDNNYEIIKLLADNGANLNHPKHYPPIIAATDSNKLRIVKLLKKKGANINTKDKTYTTAFTISVIKKNKEIAEYLLKSNVDHSYIGGESDDNPITISIYNKDIDMLKILLDNNVNLNQQSRYLDYPAHFLFMQLQDKSYNVIPYNLRQQIIKNTLNLNKKNIKGNTIMHYLLKYDNWKKYKNELKNRRIDLTIKNDADETPLSYIKSEKDKKELLKLVYNNYKSLLKENKNWVYTFDYKCSKLLNNNIKKFTEMCEKQIMNDIKEDKPYPLTTYDNNKNIKLLTNDYSINSTFSTTTIFNVIYTLIILKKYSTVSIPFIYNPLIKQQLGFIDSSHDSIYNLYKTPIAKGIVDLMNIYSSIMVELANFIIIWYNKNINYIPLDLKEAILLSSYRSGVKFIFIRLSLIVTNVMNHANVLIYDIENNTIERFDPYGVVPYGTPDDLDDYLEKYFKKIINKNIKYLRPKDYMDNVSFQIISNENLQINKKYGDPGGYCLAWVYWYIEMRLMNKTVKPKILIEKLINKINDSKLSFLEYIRNYANDLDKNKTIFFAQSGLDKKKWYNDTYNQKDMMLIINQINNDYYRMFY